MPNAFVPGSLRRGGLYFHIQPLRNSVLIESGDYIKYKPG